MIASDRGAGPWIAVLIAVAYFAIMMPLGTKLVLNYPDERHYAYGGARMIETGDWLIPRTPEGEIRLKKPILPYWFSAAGFEILGVNVAGFRLFWVVGAGAILLLTFALARALGAGIGASLLAELLLAANPLFLRATVNAIPDIPLTLFVTMAALGFARLLLRQDDRSAGWLAWHGIALAILSKGMLPLALVAVTLLYAAVFDRHRLARLLPPLPILAALALVLAWYLFAWLSYPSEFVDQFFSDQVADKISRSPFFPVYAFPGYLLVAIFSFIGWPLFLVIGVIRSGGSLSIGAWPTAHKVLAVWIVAVALIFSFGDGIAGRYILPVVPIAAALIARGLAALEGDGLPQSAAASRMLLVPVAISGLVIVLVAAAVEAQLVSIAAAGLILVLGTAVWAGIGVVGWRHPPLAPFLLSATPVLVLAVLLEPVERLSLPDLGEPLAARLRQFDVSPGKAVFIGDIHIASALRLNLGRTDAFREIDADDGPIGDACIVITTSGAVAADLPKRGFEVEAVKAGWRKIDAKDFLRAALAGRLAQARADNASVAYFGHAGCAVSRIAK